MRQVFLGRTGTAATIRASIHSRNSAILPPAWLRLVAMSARFCGVIMIGVLFASCFNPNYDHPMCGPNGECPSGLICDSLGTCEPLPDTCQAFGLHCPTGQICAVNQAVCVDIGGCGDDILEPGEVCDDGNIVDGDGCSNNCFSDETCGNGIIDTHSLYPEECDHGKLNGTTNDNCSISCHLASRACGNGIVDQNMGEQCDPGVMDSADCNSSMAGAFSCKAARCGDGYTNVAASEQCDSAGNDTAQCLGVSCRLSQCGDNYVNFVAGEECESGGNNTSTCNGKNAGPASCHLPLCGDGYINTVFAPSGSSSTEQCDNLGGIDTTTCNGNNHGNNGPGSCRAPVCGDGYTNSATGEQCDNLGGVDTVTCNGINAGTANCKAVACGDGYRNTRAGEECDTLGGADTSICNGSNAGAVACHKAICGDGYINAADGEQCERDADCTAPARCSLSCHCV